MGIEFYTRPQQDIVFTQNRNKTHFYLDWLRVSAACIKATTSQI